MKTCLIACLLLSLCARLGASSASAEDPLVAWDITRLKDNTGNFVESTHAQRGLRLTPVVLARPLSNPASGLGTAGQAAIRTWQFNGAEERSLGAAIAANDFISFTLEPEAGRAIVVNAVTLLASRGGGRPVRVALLASTSGFASGKALAEAVIESTTPAAPDVIELKGFRVEAGAPCEFRLYFYDAEEAHVGVRLGNRSVQNAFALAVYGSVVPGR